MKTQTTRDKGFGTGSTSGKGDKVRKDKGRQESGAEPRKKARTKAPKKYNPATVPLGIRN